MTPEEAAFFYGDYSILREIYLGETSTAKVEDTTVAETFFEDIPF